MVTIRTDLGDLRESARRIRFEQTAHILDTNVQDAITTLDTEVSAISSRRQRPIASSGDLPVLSNDSILNINSGSDLTPTVPVASGRSGAPLTFKNLVGSHTQTLGRSGGDTFDGQTSLTLVAGAFVTLVPYNDGVNAGYAIE